VSQLPDNDSLLVPSLSKGSDQDLTLESTLLDLPLYDFAVSSETLCLDIAPIFEEYPLLPGVIIKENGNFLGAISRYRLLEYLIRPKGIELFGQQPIKLLYSYCRTAMLILPETTSILTATPKALRRAPELRHEPIIVKLKSQEYRLLDIHELNIGYWQIRGIETQVRYERTHTQIVRAQKMANLGRLVDGVAHEILDPVGFIWGNLTYVENYTQSLLELVSNYDANMDEVPPQVKEMREEFELDFLKEDLSRTIGSIKAGAQRLSFLAKSLQNFCHIDEINPKPADLNACIDGILLLLKSRISGEILIKKNYGYLPPVNCYIGQLNQVFMNIFTNAINALINEAVSREFSNNFKGETKDILGQPCIEVTTEVCTLEEDKHQLNQRWVSIKIADNGPGISYQKEQKIRESFTTKKRADKETSLGVSYQIITAKHGGHFNFTSNPANLNDDSTNKGTEFHILLPLL
jgi:signal transduction histidine kinase